MWFETATIIGAFAIGFILTGWKVRKWIHETVDGIAETLSGIFEKPTVKKAFSVLGKRSAEVQKGNRMVDAIAGDVLNSPKIKGLKMAASAIGLDIDSYIEEYGAVDTLQALQQFAPMLGIDIGQLVQGGASGPGVLNTTTQERNPYL